MAYTKDATRYAPLFSEPGTIILELDNELTSNLTGAYTMSLYATFYASSIIEPAAPQANTIIPIFTLSNTSADVSVPPAFSTNVTFPRNAVAVYAELYASGNGDEEFWYTNVANGFLSDLPAGEAYGNGPFREVRLLVDGQVAGVAFPYSIIFSGGLVPTAWRPITSYGALDLPTYFLDLTPFVPVFTHGDPHNISLDVVSAETDHTINDNWYVSASLQVITDPSSEPTTGQITRYDVQPYAQTTTNGISSNGQVNVTVTASHSIQIKAEFVSGSGEYTSAVWSQMLHFSNGQYYSNNFSTMNIVQTASGTSSSTHNGVTVVTDQSDFPLSINYSAPNATYITAGIDQSYERTLRVASLITESTIKEGQLALGSYNLDCDYEVDGSNNNTFSYVDVYGKSYYRTVQANAGNVTYDSVGVLRPPDCEQSASE